MENEIKKVEVNSEEEAMNCYGVFIDTTSFPDVIAGMMNIKAKNFAEIKIKYGDWEKEMEFTEFIKRIFGVTP